jgi:hypothetical protein
MAFVVACIVVEGQSKLIKPWYGITIEHDMRVADLYAEFCDGKYDNDSCLIRIDDHLSKFLPVSLHCI